MAQSHSSGYLYEAYKLNLKHKFKIKANDYVDFRNLLYCTDGCHYLTFEKNTKMGVAKMLKIYAPQFVVEHMEDIRNVALEQQKKLNSK